MSYQQQNQATRAEETIDDALDKYKLFDICQGCEKVSIELFSHLLYVLIGKVCKDGTACLSEFKIYLEQPSMRDNKKLKKTLSEKHNLDIQTVYKTLDILLQPKEHRRMRDALKTYVGDMKAFRNAFSHSGDTMMGLMDGKDFPVDKKNKFFGKSFEEIFIILNRCVSEIYDYLERSPVLERPIKELKKEFLALKDSCVEKISNIETASFDMKLWVSMYVSPLVSDQMLKSQMEEKLIQVLTAVFRDMFKFSTVLDVDVPGISRQGDRISCYVEVKMSVGEKCDLNKQSYRRNIMNMESSISKGLIKRICDKLKSSIIQDDKFQHVTVERCFEEYNVRFCGSWGQKSNSDSAFKNK